MAAFAMAQEETREKMVEVRSVVRVVNPCLEIKIVDESQAPFLLVEFGSGSQV